MSFILATIGGLVLIDAFGASHFATRQQWEAGLGVLLVILGVIVYLAREWDDD